MTVLFNPDLCLPPGIHPGLSMESYLALPAVGSSFLRALDHDCPALALHEAESVDEPARAWTTQERGTALHALLLEPARFHERYVQGVGCDGILKSGERAGKPCGAATGRLVRTAAGPRFYCGKHDDLSLPADGRILIPDEARAEVIAMADALRVVAGQIIEGASHREVTVVWIDEETGLPCKARLDLVHEESRTAYDVKALADVAPQRWGRVLLDGGLHYQAVHHLEGARAVGLAVERFGWISVRNAAPYLAVVQPPLDPGSAEVAATLWRSRLEQVAEHNRTGSWPAYTAPEASSLPSWFVNQYAEEV